MNLLRISKTLKLNISYSYVDYEVFESYPSCIIILKKATKDGRNMWEISDVYNTLTYLTYTCRVCSRIGSVSFTAAVTKKNFFSFLSEASPSCYQYVCVQGCCKSLARPTSRCILSGGENISFDASLVYLFIYIYIYIVLIFLQL